MIIPVVIGIIRNSFAEVLISKRSKLVPQAELWEFPGGKIEIGETEFQALQRELAEEVGVQVKTAQPLITIKHDYPKQTVELNVWEVLEFYGTAIGLEQQQIQWLAPNLLHKYQFPAANYNILRAIQLPREYAILSDAEPAQLRQNLVTILQQGVKLIQLRCKQLPANIIQEFLIFAIPICQQYSAELLLNSAIATKLAVNPVGLHLTSADLMVLTQRPQTHALIAASCHDLKQLQHAEKLGVDFAVLAPVLTTPTHPDAKVLGWEKFATLVAQTKLPVFALGGMQAQHKLQAYYAGAQGIAGIRLFLS